MLLLPWQSLRIYRWQRQYQRRGSRCGWANDQRIIWVYTPDAESSAYTGIGAGNAYAKVEDLNALRIAVENLRKFVEDATQALNAVIDDLQSHGISG